jgi:hypothetical protein
MWGRLACGDVGAGRRWWMVCKICLCRFVTRRLSNAGMMSVQPRGVCEGVHIRSRSAQRTCRRGRPCRVRAPRASRRRGSMARIDQARAASGLRSAIPPASPCSGRGARNGIDDFWNLFDGVIPKTEFGPKVVSMACGYHRHPYAISGSSPMPLMPWSKRCSRDRASSKAASQYLTAASCIGRGQQRPSS